MSGTRTSTCRVCGEHFEHGVIGRPPKFCPRHKSVANRARLAREARSRGQHGLSDQILQGEGQEAGAERIQAAPVLEALRPRLIAIGLQVSDDPKVAASVVGLQDLPEGEIAALAAVARSEHGALIEGRVDAVSSLGHTGISLLLAGAIAGAGQVPPSQRAAAAQRLTDTLQRLNQTSAKRVYSQVVLDTGADV